MNKQFFLKSTCIVALSMIMSCSNNDDSNDMRSNNAIQIQAAVTATTNGSWRITSYVDSGQDETLDFSGYNFIFAANGSVTATNSTTTQTGTWSITDDGNFSDDDDNNDDDIDFNLNFPVPDTNDFEDLNDDWDIVAVTDTQINLIDVSGGNGGTDILIFTRN